VSAAEADFPPVPRSEFLPRPETLPQPQPMTLMTLQVSTDSGRTWGPRRKIRSTDPLDAFAVSAWPPCECPRCRSQR
jgi:hypothetical protein